MVVVVIAGTLAMIGVATLKRQMSSSRATEAMTMIQSIRAAQEQNRSTQGVYLDVSQSGTWYPWDPAASANRGKQTTFFQGIGGSHPDNARWLALNPTAPGPTRFGYQTTAGLPGDPMTAPAITVPGLTWPTPNEPWYVIQAVADADADGEVAFFLASSINGEVYHEHLGE
jgi:type II secretory pathway pseudopilin PulG